MNGLNHGEMLPQVSQGLSKSQKKRLKKKNAASKDAEDAQPDAHPGRACVWMDSSQRILCDMPTKSPEILMCGCVQRL